MYNKSNLKRDLFTTGVIFAVAFIAVAGGATKTPPPKDSGPIHAGATLEESQPTKDVFDRAAPKDAASQSPELATKPHEQRQQPASKQPAMAAEVPPKTLATTPTRSMPGQPDPTAPSATKPDDPKIDTQVVQRLTQPTAPRATSKPVNPVEPEQKPLNEMSETEIKEKLAEYRTWVHEGEIDIELDITRLSKTDVARLVEFYVMRTDASRMRMNLDGAMSRLTEIPEGRLIADLPNESQWHPATRTNADVWLGGGIVDVNVAIVLNQMAELHLYRVLVDGLNGTHSEPGSTVIVAIEPQGKELVFAVVEVTPTNNTKRSKV